MIETKTERRTIVSLLALSLMLLPAASTIAEEGKKMSGQVVEVVEFKLAAGKSEAELLTSSEAATAFMRGQKGFIARRLSRGENGTYTDHVVWASRADAEAAMEASLKDQSLAPFMEAIDPQSIKLDHQELLVSVN